MTEPADRLLTALIALEEAVAAEGGGPVTLTLPEEVGIAAERSLAERVSAGALRRAGPGQAFAKGTLAIRSGFRWGRVTVLWASRARQNGLTRGLIRAQALR